MVLAQLAKINWLTELKVRTWFLLYMYHVGLTRQ